MVAKTYTNTYKGSTTDFLFPIKPNLPRLLGFHQATLRVGLRETGYTKERVGKECRKKTQETGYTTEGQSDLTGGKPFRRKLRFGVGLRPVSLQEDPILKTWRSLSKCISSKGGPFHGKD